MCISKNCVGMRGVVIQFYQNVLRETFVFIDFLKVNAYRNWFNVGDVAGIDRLC